MQRTLAPPFQRSSVNGNSLDARQIVDSVLGQAIERRASDLHVEPTGAGYEIRLRVDGLLTTVQQLESEAGRSVVLRLMVMAHLLTYRMDVPQEGRMNLPLEDRSVQLRISVMPTTHGLRAVVRLPAELLQPTTLDELQLPAGVIDGLRCFAAGDSGMLILTGPAGSGKTTTIYALLEEIAQSRGGLSIIALEDPVERHLPGVTQIEVQPFGELTYERTLRSILRQDPQVLMLGEIRDAATASLAIQAALCGHRLISTLHAATAGGAIARLMEMGIEPYQLTSAIWGIVSQRLMRRREADGYHGRVPIAELALMDEPLRQAILRRSDAQEMDQITQGQSGFIAMRTVAEQLVAGGITDEAELLRVLGNQRASV